MKTPRALALLCLACGFFAVLVGPLFASHDPASLHLDRILEVPGQAFLLGTDANGRDILAQILHGARLSLFLGVIVVFNSVWIGVALGFLAGYFGGKVDRIFILVSDVFQAFPGMLLAIAIAAFLAPGIKNLVILLSFVGWVGYARVVRAQVLEMKSREFILAGQALGLKWPRLFLRHFLPNMAGPLIVQASFGMAGVILAESTLSFLGLGLPESVPSLGKIMDSGVGLLLVAPHVAFFPGLVIMFFVLSFNMVGDYFRERLV